MKRIIKRGVYILHDEGINAFLTQVLSFISSFFYREGTYYIYEKHLTESKQYQFAPKIENVTVKIISTTEEFEKLLFEGYSFKMMNFNKYLERGAIAFCAFVNKELAHVTWVALNERAKREIDPLPFKVRFQEHEVCSGASFTVPKFRGKGILSYIYSYVFPYLVQRGIVKDKFTIEIRNISSQKAHARFNPLIISKGRYLKLLWWKFWKEESVKELKL